MTKLQPGDRVRYARAFLRDICAQRSAHTTPQRRATVVSIEAELRRDGPCPIVVHWDDGATRRVLSCNLEACA